MQKTYKPVVACILILIVGCYMIFLLAPALLIGGGMYSEHWKQSAFFISPLVTVIIGITAFVSGIFARSRKRWRFVVASSVCVILVGSIFTALDRFVLEAGSFNILSMIVYLIPTLFIIPALVLAILSKKEFESSTKPNQITSK